MVEHADVVVVGARCAGASAAMLFARAGRRVVVLERGQIGTDPVCTLYIQPPAMEQLRRWSLLDDVVALGAPELPTTTYCVGGATVAGRARWPAGTPSARAPRRRDLDRVLAEAASAAGADLRVCSSFTGVVTEGGRVCGVRFTARGSDGRRVEHQIRAPLVVGADGMRSALAATVGGGYLRKDATLTCAYYTFWEGMEATFGMYEGTPGWVSSVPTSHGQVLVSAYFPQSRFGQVRTDALTAYHACVAEVAPSLHAMMHPGDHAEPLAGFGDQQNFIRQAWGPGWALIGDAGHHKDSLTARGIGDAFLQAELLTCRLADADGPEATDAGLTRFARERDVLLADSYRATLVVADPENRPSRARLLSAVADDSELTQTYLDTVAGIAPMSRLYTDDLLERLTGAHS
jgi:flavin-dependent dehydrogenase